MTACNVVVVQENFSKTSFQPSVTLCDGRSGDLTSTKNVEKCDSRGLLETLTT